MIVFADIWASDPGHYDMANARRETMKGYIGSVVYDDEPDKYGPFKEGADFWLQTAELVRIERVQ